MYIAKLTASLLALVALVVSAVPARAETVNCTAITTLPAVITVQGVYCFTGDLSTAMTSGAAIDIQTNNLVLDLNGFKLGGLAAGPGTLAFGIHAFQRRNITIKNGTVRGFVIGIFLSDESPFTTSQGHRVEGVRADGNTGSGIVVFGQGSVIRGNHVVATGGNNSPGLCCDGIGVAGPGVRVLDNDVIETVASAPGTQAMGINLITTPGGVVEGNRVGNQTASTDAVGIQAILSSTNVLIVGNRLQGWPVGVSVPSPNTGRCRDNFFAGDVTTKLSGCADVANNN